VFLGQAVWNGHAGTVNMLLGPWADAVSDNLVNPWAARIVLNKYLFAGKYGELDLALAKNLINCARIIVRNHPAGAVCVHGRAGAVAAAAILIFTHFCLAPS
jgi:hypothetical protein